MGAQLGLSNKLVIDTGASRHIIGRREWLHNYEEFQPGRRIGIKYGRGMGRALGEGSLHLAIDGAAEKLEHALASQLGKLMDKLMQRASFADTKPGA